MLDAVAGRLAGVAGLTCRPARGGLALVGDDGTIVLAKDHSLGGERALVLMAWVCHESAADPSAMLRIAGQLGSGAIALDGTSYTLRFTVPGAQVDAAPLPEIVAYLGRAAREVGERMAAAQRRASEAQVRAFDYAVS